MKTLKLNKSNHNFMKAQLIICLLVIQSAFCLAQDARRSPDVQNFIPPVVSGLYQYMTIPVGLYNGVPQIEIPLYTVSDKSISLPLSLSYHASGIKMDECASDVGLGWTLKCGGMITRITRGISDKFDNTYEDDNIAAWRDSLRDFEEYEELYHLAGIGTKDGM